jgi:hypothetical protein
VAGGVSVTQTGEAGAYGTRREQRAWYWYDWANSAFPTTVITVFAGPFLTAAAEAAADGRRAVQAAADAPARLAGLDLRAARLLVRLPRDEVLTDAVTPDVADRLRTLDTALGDTVLRLARGAFGRDDADAARVVRACVVHLPAALLFPEIRDGLVRPHTRAQLAAAVGVVVDLGPPS